MTLAQRARVLMEQFESLPLEADGSTRVPSTLRREIIDLALDVLGGPASRAKARTPEMLRMPTSLSSIPRQDWRACPVKLRGGSPIAE
jgi:hypothetical protein